MAVVARILGYSLLTAGPGGYGSGMLFMSMTPAPPSQPCCSPASERLSVPSQEPPGR